MAAAAQQHDERQALKVSAFQGASDAAGDVKANIATIRAAAKDAAGSGSRLLLFPELFLTGYDTPAQLIWDNAIDLSAPVVPDSPLEQLKQAAAEHRIALAVGYAEKELVDDASSVAASRQFRSKDNESSDASVRYFNSLVVIDETGQVVFNYRKMHLWCNGAEGFEANVFDTGDAAQLRTFVLQPLDIRVGVLICYDIEFPEAARELFLQGVDLLLVPTALAFPNEVIPRCVLPCRAIENHVFILYSNFPRVDLTSNEDDQGRVSIGSKPITFTGLSAILDSEGRELVRAGYNFVGVLTATLDFAAGRREAARNPYDLHRRPACYRRLAPY